MTVSKRSLLLAGLLVASLAAPAGADDEGPAFNAEDLVLTEEQLPDTWSVTLDEPPAGLPSEETFAELAGDDAYSIIIEYRHVVSKDGQHAVVAISDVDLDDPGPYVRKIEARGEEAGWIVRPLGHPKRLLVIAGPETTRDRMFEVQREAAAENLVRLAYLRILADYQGLPPRPSDVSMERAREYASASREILSNNDAATTLLGILDVFGGDAEAGVRKIEEGLEGSSTIEPTEAMRVLALSVWARPLVVKNDEAANRETLAVLERAVEMERVGFDEARERKSGALRTDIWGNRYNLACIQARLGQLETAYEQLEEALKLGKMVLGRAYPFHFRHLWIRDPDMEPLRTADEERWKKLMEEHKPEDFDFEKERKAEEERKRKAEEAKKKGAPEAGSGEGEPEDPGTSDSSSTR